MTYEEWLEHRTVCDPNILSGTRVFQGSRLSVGLLGRRAVIEGYDVVMEDYPYLSGEDIGFATIYVDRNK